jgi:hypothetical protein
VFNETTAGHVLLHCQELTCARLAATNPARRASYA